LTEDGLVLSNRYRLQRQLATGGMGEVWEANDELLIRPVAVKLLRREYISDDAARTRFRAEARFAAALQHGGIAQVYDYGEQDDLAYLVMELVPGEPLSRILARNGGLSPDIVLDLSSQAARALQIAHDAGIIHRDIKPSNLMVTADGTLKITDFGIARNGAVSELTQTGMVMGTAHYVSPEQASGKAITPATDLYSLGVVMFECLAGRPPFDADSTVAIALKHVREKPPDLPPEVPAPVRELVRQLLAKDPRRRPAGAQEVADRTYMIRESLTFGSAFAEAGEGQFGEFTELAGFTDYADYGEYGQHRDFADTEMDMAAPFGGSGAGTAAGRTTATAPATAGGRQRRHVVLFTSIAVSLVVLGLIVVGSLFLVGRDGNLMEGTGGHPAQSPGGAGSGPASAPADVPQGDSRSARPAAPAPSTERAPTPSLSATTTPTSKPTGPRSPRPTPTATKTSPAPSPTPPDPTEGGGDGRGLSSDSKV
jgi:tRNA A-37 threonylcarbamoyl transferase component Bud32